jgi:hypothetical protein
MHICHTLIGCSEEIKQNEMSWLVAHIGIVIPTHKTVIRRLKKDFLDYLDVMEV